MIHKLATFRPFTSISDVKKIFLIFFFEGRLACQFSIISFNCVTIKLYSFKLLSVPCPILIFKLKSLIWISIVIILLIIILIFIIFILWLGRAMDIFFHVFIFILNPAISYRFIVLVHDYFLKYFFFWLIDLNEYFIKWITSFGPITSWLFIYLIWKSINNLFFFVD